MTRCPIFNFQLSIISKRHARHISTKVSLKIPIRTRYVYIDIGWSWIWKYCFYLGIWNDDVLKLLLCLHFRSLHDWIHKTQMKRNLLMNSDIWIYLWILVIPIDIIEFSTSRTCCFWLYFSSIHDYWLPSTCNPFVHTSWGEIERFK